MSNSSLDLDGWRSPLRSDRFEMSAVSQVFTQRNSPTDSTIHDPLSVGKGGVTDQLENIAKSLKTDGRKLVVKGDIVINSRSDRRGASGLASRTGSVSLIYIVLEPRLDRIDPRFAHHLIRSTAFQDEFYRFGTGIVADLWSTRYERMSQIRIPLPSLDTQQRIADYLDRETAEIDAAVADLDRYVELLEKRRLLTVDEVLYSSGVATPGWPEMPLKFIIQERFVGDWGGEPGTADVDSVCVRVADFDRPTNTVSDQVPTTRSYSREKYEAKRLWHHDILVERSGGGEKTPVGSAMLYTGGDEALCANFIEVVRLKEDQLPEYWVHVLRREYMGRKMMRFVKQTTGIQNLDPQGFYDQKFPVPSLAEQRSLAADLRERTSEIDSLIAESTKLRELLLKRRSVLITEVVTGRKEV